MRLILASASPRRAEILRNAGFAFDVVAADVDETPREGERPEDYVRRLAMEKSAAVYAGLKSCATGLKSCATVGSCAAEGDTVAQDFSPADAIIIAADTTVVVDGAILAKPVDDRDAARMLRLLSGRSHEVLTGVSVRCGLRESGSVEKTAVRFAELSETEIGWYVTNGEGRDKAGGYAIQGLASRFVTGIEGSYANVVGLPISVVYKLLKPFETGYPDA